MNILFINYGGLRSNSMEHIRGFAGALQQQGHDCVVAIPESETDRDRSISLVTYRDLFDVTQLFANEFGPDVIHAWTPRECVRKAVWPVLQQCLRARLIIHLEDNEQWISARSAGVPYSQLVRCSLRELAYLVPGHCMHPVYGPAFLRLADGITTITPALADFVPEGIPVQTLLPGVDFNEFCPQRADPGLRKVFEIPENARLIYYPGGVNAMNRDDLLLLFQALPLINQKKLACHLVQTGPHADEFIRKVAPEVAQYIHVLGYIDRAMVPQLMAMADVLVQPGRIDMFNRYRLPSKIPQFLASGRPVIIPDTNIAGILREDEEVLLLKTDDPAEIAKRCMEVFMNPNKAASLGKAAVTFAHANFDLTRNAEELLSFYESVEKRDIIKDKHYTGKEGWSGALKLLDPLWLLSRLRRLKFRGKNKPDESPLL